MTDTTAASDTDHERGQLTVDEQFADAIYPAPWTLSGLRDREWQGFERLVGLEGQSVATRAGVYVIARSSSRGEPVFTGTSVFRGNRGPLGLDALAARWVHGTEVMYIGKAAGGRGIRQRLLQFAGKGANHAGGRAIWQLFDHEELLVAWFVTPDEVHAALAESALLSRFRRAHNGMLPFANG